MKEVKRVLKIFLFVILALILLLALFFGLSVLRNRLILHTASRAAEMEIGDFDVLREKLELVWSDEFDHEGLKGWVYEGHGVQRNKEEQVYADSDSDGNAYTKDGCLVIEARREDRLGKHYTSASLTTQGKSTFRYGLFEMRARLPEGRGVWPAFWMLGQPDWMPVIKGLYAWPYGGEIDIMEYIGEKDGNNTAHGTMHWCNTLEEMKKGIVIHGPAGLDFLREGKLSDDFHLYSFAWSEKEMVWALDGREYLRVDISGEKYASLKRSGWFILLNLAIGGDWPGSPNDKTPFPAKYEIDYVRVYQ